MSDFAERSPNSNNNNLNTSLISKDERDHLLIEQEEDKKEIVTRVNRSSESDEHKTENSI